MNKLLTFFFVFFGYLHWGYAQKNLVKLSPEMFHSHQRIFLDPIEGWVFQQGNDPEWANPEMDVSGW